jgi:hypothetical protein
MKIKKEYAVLFFIITVLVFYIYSEKGEKTHYELPEIKQIEEDSISELIIRSKESEIVIARDNDRWLVGDKKYPADKKIIESMLKNISGLTLTALASESKNYSMYELDEKNIIEVEAYKGDHVLRKIGIGKPASSHRHTFVMLDNDHRVFHAEGNIKNDFNKKVSDLRDKRVMTIVGDIAELMLKKGNEEITIVRAEAPVSVDVTEKEEEQAKPVQAGPKWVIAEGTAVKDSEIDGIINALSNFLSDEFIEDRVKDDFKSPVFTAILKGADTYTISFFEKEDSQYPAVSSESDYPFFVSERKAHVIMKDLESLLQEGT